MSINVGSHCIGSSHLPFIIAEMSGNHNQSIERAYAIIDAAVESGVHAIKLQTYTPDTITMKGAFKITDEDSLWKGQELYNLYESAYTPWEWHRPMFEYAKKKGILIFSSPFDETAVDFLESLDVPLYKIASFENTDHSLLQKVAATGKPVIMSTGASTIADIDESVKILRDNGCKDLVLLKCTSTYPASPDNSNLRAIPLLKSLFNCEVGLSDHTMGIGVPLAAIALGATVIEKHFTLRRSDGGVDSAFSLEPEEFALLVKESSRAYKSLGENFIGIQESEKKSIQFKRSLYVVQDIKKGEIITKDNVKSKRPSIGLHTRNYKAVIGMKAKLDIKKGTPLDWDLIEH